jgi:N-formylglutamate amidohydrolase
MPFEIINPTNELVPILVSVPHCGTIIPNEIKQDYQPDRIKNIDDTDFYVDRLYDFVGDLGIKMIKAKYSRWVIDLNRNAESKALYNDGRVITGLCPTSDFNGNKIYRENEPSQEEINRRISTFYYPYYDQIRLELGKLQKQFKHVLFFDAHSIRQFVPGIRPDKFPDLILGDVDESSAGEKLIQSATNVLTNSGYIFNHNHPFKGGNLTRTFGRPNKQIHGLQLEMAKMLYMDDSETKYDQQRADKIRITLHSLFEELIFTLSKLNAA